MTHHVIIGAGPAGVIGAETYEDDFVENLGELI